MSQKHKYKKLKKAAFQKRNIVATEAMKYGIDIFNDYLSIGILIESLAASQCAFFLIDSLNKLLDKIVNIDIIVFLEHLSSPCLMPKFPIFDIGAFSTYNDIVLVSSINTCLRAIDGQSQYIFYYVFDIDFLNNNVDIASLYHVFKNPKVKIFTRSEDYRKILETEFDIKINGLIIPNWNFDIMLPNIISTIKETKDVKT